LQSVEAMRPWLLLVVVAFTACAGSGSAFWEPKTGIRIGAPVASKSKDPSPALASQPPRVCPLPDLLDGERVASHPPIAGAHAEAQRSASAQAQ